MNVRQRDLRIMWSADVLAFSCDVLANRFNFET